MTILDKIIARKHIEVAERKAQTSASVLLQSSDFGRVVNSARAAICADTSTGIIAEFKRKSPSKGIINDRVSVADTTAGYVLAGAACLSVLTDEPFFGGTPTDLREARQANPTTPILRKDFMIDEYQLLEARAWGADFVLLIAACLSPDEVGTLSQRAHDLGMEVLLEIHDETELAHLCDTVDLVGVNNRNLKTFETSIETSIRLIEQIPVSFVRITESGLHDAATLQLLREVGYDGFLIGEAFMKTAAPGNALAELVQNFGPKQTIHHSAMAPTHG